MTFEALINWGILKPDDEADNDKWLILAPLLVAQFCVNETSDLNPD
jgi:hypothetical protein